MTPDPPDTREVVRITRRDGTVSVFPASTRKHPRKTDRPDGDALPPEPIPLPVTVEDFAALVAELRAEVAAARPIDRERLIRRNATPDAFTGRPWAWTCLTLAEAAPLTGRAKGTLRMYARPNETGPVAMAKNGPAARDFPEPAARDEREGAARSPARLWETGALALWCATRSEKTSRAAMASAGRRPSQQPRPPRGGAKGGAKRDGTWARSLSRRRVAALAYMRALVREDTAVTVETAGERITAAGLDLTGFIAAGITRGSLLTEARQQEIGRFIERLESGAVHGDGTLVTTSQIGAAFGVGSTQVMKAWHAGRLVAAAGGGPFGSPLFDPARLRAWTGGRTPADMDHPEAVPLPGEITG